jgi:hypothetical protein
VRYSLVDVLRGISRIQNTFRPTERMHVCVVLSLSLGV